MAIPKLQGSAPVLLVRDVVATADYYRDRLGFRYEHFWGEPPCFCILDRDGCHLMLSQVAAGVRATTNGQTESGLWDVYFWVDDARGAYERALALGAEVTGPPEDAPYGCREFVVRDPDGHLIAFGEVLDD